MRALLAGDRRVTGGVLNITAAAWTAGFQRWRSGDITRTQNVSEYVLVLALCLVVFCDSSCGSSVAAIREPCSVYYFASFYVGQKVARSFAADPSYVTDDYYM